MALPVAPWPTARRRSFRALALTCSLLGLARSARAEGSVPLSFEAALADGARLGPLVAEARAVRASTAALAREPGVGLPSLPQLGIMVGARVPQNLPIGPETGLTLQQDFALRDLGGARRGALRLAEVAASADLRRARGEGAAAAALSWIALREAQALAALRDEALAETRRLAAIADARVLAGTATPLERALAEAEIGTAKLAVLEAEGRATEARIALAHGTGRDPQTPLVAAGDLGDPRPAGPLAAPPAEGASAAHPAVRSAEARAAQLAQEGAAVRALLGPALGVGVSVWREGSGDRAATALLSVPITLFDPARYEAGKQQIAAAAAEAHARRLRVDLAREIGLARHEEAHAREVVEALAGGVLAPSRRALQAALAAYASGATELTTVIVARRSTLAAEERLVTARADVRRADVRSALAAGALGKEIGE